MTLPYDNATLADPVLFETRQTYRSLPVKRPGLCLSLAHGIDPDRRQPRTVPRIIRKIHAAWSALFPPHPK